MNQLNLKDQTVSLKGLHLGANSSTFTFDGQERDVHLALGYQSLMQEVFEKQFSLALASEVGIQKTEEALMQMQAQLKSPPRLSNALQTTAMDEHCGQHHSRCQLCVDGEFLAHWGREGQGSHGLDRSHLERVFHQWFALLQGADAMSPFSQKGKVFFIQLLVLRECMHHLDIECFELSQAL